MKNFNAEMIEKAKAAKSAEELIEIAKASGVEMNSDEAATYFAQLNPKSGELDDDDLDNVAGGACNQAAPQGMKKINAFTNADTCKNRECANCGNRGTKPTGDGYGTDVCTTCGTIVSCSNCAHFTQIDGTKYCTKP